MPNKTTPTNMPIKLAVHLSSGAGKIMNAEEAQMLVKWIWAEMEIKKDCNLFRFPKMGVCIIRDGSELVILTDDEHRNALNEEHKTALKEEHKTALKEEHKTALKEEHKEKK